MIFNGGFTVVEYATFSDVGEKENNEDAVKVFVNPQEFTYAERFSECPFCNQTRISTVVEGEDGEENLYTQPLTPPDITEPIPDPDIEEFSKTVGVYDDLGAEDIEPVVGWLVAISGDHLGQDFKLKTGRNFIGRSAEMDVALEKDNSISREKHAIILYEPKSNMFLVQPGDAKQLFYLNEKVVLEATKIAAYDVLSLGETNLLFIPCCSAKFNWDSVKKEADKNE